MTSTSTMTAFVLALVLACFRQASAFVVPGTAGLDLRLVDMHRVHRNRLERPSNVGRRKRSVPCLSILKGDSGGYGSEVGRVSDGANEDSRETSTRREFGAGLGAAAAAIMLGGRNALAEDSSTAVASDAAAAGVAEAAQQAQPEFEAPAAAASTAAETPPLRDLGFEVPYTGKSVPLSKFLGSRATLVVNPKLDDPESLHQVCLCLCVRLCCVCVRFGLCARTFGMNALCMFVLVRLCKHVSLRGLTASVILQKKRL